MKDKVLTMQFRFFSSVNGDFKTAKEQYEYVLEQFRFKANHHKDGHTTRKNDIIAYFDDDKDVYKVAILGGFCDLIEKEVYGWDELSQLIHDNL